MQPLAAIAWQLAVVGRVCEQLGLRLWTPESGDQQAVATAATVTENSSCICYLGAPHLHGSGACGSSQQSHLAPGWPTGCWPGLELGRAATSVRSSAWRPSTASSSGLGSGRLISVASLC